MDSQRNAGTPRQIAGPGFTAAIDVWTRGYSISPDGRLLAIRDLEHQVNSRSQIKIVLNWFSELHKLVP